MTSTSHSAGHLPSGSNTRVVETQAGPVNVYNQTFGIDTTPVPKKGDFQKIWRNPILDICQRLAVCNTQNGRIVDPKAKYGLVGKPRLFQMIGNRLRVTTWRRFSSLSAKQWKTLEEAWCANMHTVLLNPEFIPNRCDWALYKAISIYKIWFIEFFTQGLYLKGERGYYVKLYNTTKGLRSLKAVAAWIGWQSCSDMSNEKPSPLPFWKGWITAIGRLRLPWFAGHLERYRDILLKKNSDLTDRDLHVLCQIRTFGRALPCATADMCRDSLVEQMTVLTTDRPIDEKVRQTFGHFAGKMSATLGFREMPTHTHISVSTSGELDTPSKDGGKAEACRKALANLDIPMSDLLVSQDGLSFGPITDLPEFGIVPIGTKYVYLDAYNCEIVRNIKLFLPDSGRAQMKRADRISDCIYRAVGPRGSVGFADRRDQAERLMGQKLASPSTGSHLLWCSTGGALSHGRYDPVPDWYFKAKDLILPVWLEVQKSPFNSSVLKDRRIISYRPERPPEARMTSLSEPGAKPRTLSVNSWWLLCLFQAMRQMVEPILARDGRARIGLRQTNKLWSFLKLLKNLNIESPIGQSTDYKASTDYISLSMIETIWGGLLSQVPKSHPFLVFKELVWYPRKLVITNTRDPLLARDWPSHKCGSFMGEPLSFMTLTAINLLIEDISSYYFSTDIPLYDEPSLEFTGREPCAITGDDLTAVRTCEARVHLFNKVATDAGMVLSKGKDYMSSRILVFCEDHIIMVKSENRTIYTYVDVVKSRLLTTMARQHSDNRSSILGKGRMLDNQLAYLPSPRARNGYIVMYQRIFDRAFNHAPFRDKLPVFLPPNCGGLGIPTTKMFTWLNPYIWAIKRMLDTTDLAEKYENISRLRSLNARHKHGIENRSIAATAAKGEIASFQIDQSDDIEIIYDRVVYTERAVSRIVEKTTGRVSTVDPYSGQYDYTGLNNEAALLGFTRFGDVLEEIERVVNFNEFLAGPQERTQRTFGRWVKAQRKFWGSRLDLSERSDPGVTLGDLEKQVNRAFPGFVYFTTDSESLLKAGPSLRVDFRCQRLGKTPVPGKRVPRSTDKRSGIRVSDLISAASALEQ